MNSLFVIAMFAPAVLGASQSYTANEYLVDRLAIGGLFQQRKYAETVVTGERILAFNDVDGDVFLIMGRALEGLARYDDAITAYTNAARLGAVPRPNGLILVAVSHANAGREEQSLTTLRAAIDAGFPNRNGMADFPAFRKWANQPEWRNIFGLAPAGEVSRDQKWIADLEYLEREVRRLHYVYRDRAYSNEMKGQLAAIRTGIPNWSDGKVLVEMQRFLAMLGDGHSVLYGFGQKEHGRFFRLATYLFEEGSYVTDAPAGHERIIGMKILQYGSLSVDEVLQKLRPYTSCDNDATFKWLAPGYLMLSAYLQEVGGLEPDGTLRLTLVGDDGKQSTETLQAESKPFTHDDFPKKMFPSKKAGAPAAPEYLKAVGENWRFVEMPEINGVYAQFNQFVNGPNETLAQSALRLRKMITDPTIKNLVVDVRHNNGGSTGLISELLRTLIYFETSRENGLLFLITGRDTFSAAVGFCGVVDYYTNALIVGEPLGSQPNFVGEDNLFTLPYSGAFGSISTDYHQSTLSVKNERVWIAPSLPAPPTAADYFGGRDACLDAIEKWLARRRPGAESQ